MTEIQGWMSKEENFKLMDYETISKIIDLCQFCKKNKSVIQELRKNLENIMELLPHSLQQSFMTAFEDEASTQRPEQQVGIDEIIGDFVGQYSDEGEAKEGREGKEGEEGEEGEEPKQEIYDNQHHTYKNNDEIVVYSASSKNNITHKIIYKYDEKSMNFYC